MSRPLLRSATLDKFRLDTSGQASKRNREESLETISDSHFVGSGSGRVEVADNVRVSRSQDDTSSEADKNAPAKDQGCSRYRIPGFDEFFRANEDAASVEDLLDMKGLVPDELTLPLQSKTATGIEGESVPSPQPDDRWQDRNQSLRGDVVILNPGIHSIELRDRMVIV